MLTPKQEAYVQGLISGLSQRAAYKQAYNTAHMKDETIDKRASELLQNRKVAGRLAALQAETAKEAKISRVKLLQRLDNLAERSHDVLNQVYEEQSKINFNAANSLIQATKELLPYAEDETEERPPFVFDYALILGPAFLEPHRRIHIENKIDLWLAGGRGSTKSSFASVELVKHVENHPDQHALCMMRYKNQLRDSAYAQVVWAIKALGLEDEYDMPESTLRIKKRSTGQLILFRGCDNPNKIKGIKIPFGYIGFVWIEEADMFRGMAEIRKVLQSAVRGGADAIRLFSFNPPRSKSCWINAEVQRRKDEGLSVYESTYLDVPPEWLGEQFIEDAEELKRTDPQAYEHEYLGIPVGLGGDVFDRVEFREVTDEEIAAFDFPKAGQDFGWWPDPWAFVLSEWQPSTRTLITYREDGGNKLQPNEQAERIKKLLTWRDTPDGELEYHYIDVRSDDANPTAIAAQKAAGVHAKAAQKGNMRMASYEWLASVNWVIDPVRCPNLAKEVREMQYEQNADGEWLNCIPDGNDHWLDAARYSVMDIVRRGRRAYATPAEE